MDESALNAIKIIFLFGFTLHNLEEAVWLPRWSQYAKRFHAPVQPDQFIFAVIVITMLGYLLTALDFLVGDSSGLLRYTYLGFVGMMGLNSIFPHLASTVMLQKYCPGLITGLFLNLPLSLILIIGYFKNGIDIAYWLVAVIIMSSLTLFSLKYLFRLGTVLIDFSDGYGSTNNHNIAPSKTQSVGNRSTEK